MWCRALTLALCTLCSRQPVRHKDSAVSRAKQSVLVSPARSGRFLRLYALLSSRLIRQSSRCHRRSRLQNSHPHSRPSHSARARTARCPWYCANRHRQDRRLRAADADHAGAGTRARTHAAHPHPRADARTRRPGRRALRKVRQEPQAQRCIDHWRRVVRQSGCQATARRRRADRHARPVARPLRARTAVALRRRAACDRRS